MGKNMLIGWKIYSWRHHLLVTGQIHILSQKPLPRACYWRKLATYQWQLYDLRLVSLHCITAKSCCFVTKNFQPQQYFRASMNRWVDGWIIGMAQLELSRLWGKESFTQSCAMRRALRTLFQLTWWVSTQRHAQDEIVLIMGFNWIVAVFRSSTWW